MALESPRKQIVLVLAVLVLIGSLGAIWLQWKSGRTRAKPDYAAARLRGEVVAEQVVQMLGGAGPVVLVLPGGSGGDRRFDRNVEDGFSRRLQAAGTVRLVATERIPVAETRSVQVAEPFLPAARYFELLAKYPQADAIVSWVGLPYLSEKDLARLPEKLPRLLAVSGRELRGFQLQRLFARGVVQRVLLTRSDPFRRNNTEPAPGSDVPVQTPQQFLNRHYQIVTPENVGALPEAAW